MIATPGAFRRSQCQAHLQKHINACFIAQFKIEPWSRNIEMGGSGPALGASNTKSCMNTLKWRVMLNCDEGITDRWSKSHVLVPMQL